MIKLFNIEILGTNKNNYIYDILDVLKLFKYDISNDDIFPKQNIIALVFNLQNPKRA